MITQGPLVEQFEQAMAGHVGARHAVAFSSGTAALHGAAHAVGIGPGDEAIVPPITFAASANCVLYQGGDVRFADIARETWNLDTAAAAAAVGERTKAVVAVSYTGLPVDLEPLAGVRDRVAVIEDGCHALGGHRDGRPVGGPGGADITCFSLHPVKSMTTGEGGLATTEDDELAARMRRFRTHGMERERLPGRHRHRRALVHGAAGAGLQLPHHRLPVRARHLASSSASTAGSGAATRSPPATASCCRARTRSRRRRRLPRARCTATTCS